MTRTKVCKVKLTESNLGDNFLTYSPSTPVIFKSNNKLDIFIHHQDPFIIFIQNAKIHKADTQTKVYLQNQKAEITCL